MAGSGWRSASPADVEAQRVAEQDFIARRNAGKPAVIETVPYRVSDVRVVDPAVERARVKAAREIANKEHKNISKQAERAHRHKMLSEPYSGTPLLMDLLNTCNRMTPSRILSAQNYKCQCTLGLEQANEFLTSPLTDAEAVTVLQFFHAQLPNLYPDSTSFIVACDILTAENVIRQTVFSQPVAESPEPVEPEKNPYVWGSSEADLWDRAQYRREFTAEVSREFRKGALSLQLVQELTTADMKRLMVAFENMKLPLTSANVRKAGIKLYGEAVTNLTDEERTSMSQDRELNAMSSEDMKKKYGYVASYDPNKGRQAVRQ